MMAQSYQCFKFPETSLMGKHVYPAYREDIKEDTKYDSGLHAKNSRVERIRVIKVKAVYQIGTKDDEPVYSEPDDYWYHQTSGMLYDNETHYPVGVVSMENGIPSKLDNATYIISDVISIPTIEKMHGL